MPELPEVESVCRMLRSQIIGAEITSIFVDKPKIFKNSTVEEFSEYVIGETFKNVSRRGKHIIYHLTNDKIVVSHLRMEGKYHIFDDSVALEKHAMMYFQLKDGRQLRYLDSRQFGTLHMYSESDYMLSDQLAKIGPEPWDKVLDTNYLTNRLIKSTKPVKTAILDQTILTGIGNIYADEILFACNLNPLTKCKDLKPKDFKNIVKYTRAILQKAIDCGGSRIRTYTTSFGVTGSYQDHLKVHTKVGEECPVCKSIILKTKVGGRGTYYCPRCQK